MTDTIDPDNTLVSDRNDEILSFIDEQPRIDEISSDKKAWYVLIADDDEEVHHATAFALRGVMIDTRPIRLLRAYSATEAESMLKAHPNVAVAMLDVVMETPDAGLKLVDVIRTKLGLRNLRIVLRTGQPGYAPELDVIKAYDINDYRTKSELTQTRMVTTLTSAVRAYQQLEEIQAVNRGMDSISRAANKLFRLHRMQDFAQGLFAHMAEILGTSVSGLLCIERPDFNGDDDDSGLKIHYGTGQYAPLMGCTVTQRLNADMLRSIRRCIAARTHIFEADRFLLWLGASKTDAIAVFNPGEALSPTVRKLVEMFAANLTVGFENVDLIERLNFFAHYDPLTRLPNRGRFLDQVNEDLLAHRENPRVLAVADLVRFSEVNDALGYRCGDSLLVLVAKRLRTALGPGTLLARLSGDSFGIFGQEAWIDFNVLRHAFEAPFFVHGHSLQMQIRLGMASVDDGKGNALELLRNANMALGEAHLSIGSACAHYTTELSEDAQLRIGILHSLRAAIDFQRGLSLQFQPLVEIPGNTIRGVEALLRWRNESGQMVVPARFIPLAERTGMICELGRWVLESALSRLALWQSLGHKGFYISVNVSSVQFREDDLVDKVRHALEDNDVAPSSLVLEVNGSIYVEDRPKVLKHLQRLRHIGVKIALDDFGTGGVSLDQLMELPLDIIKIDQSFVQRIGASRMNLAIVRSMVELACESGIEVVAEGVETAEQMQALIGIECHTMQGFHLCRPLSAEQLDSWLQPRI
ncbi:putative bifunctional diguanylate cyclase/phosphodiesterase [Uliginosibacterium gangwonense]|uniref:putative bifunctional diguanylate cyclase/phosphodiesterase n=1 Tax=Uliginosibacterium gangwonense TaxID=392736 RepID=UPI0012FB8D84|nr:EAL domain-containing protein [Uliginosibacterium gangwonense]